MNKILKNICKFVVILAAYFIFSLFLDAVFFAIDSRLSFLTDRSTEWVLFLSTGRAFILICAGTFFFMLIYIINMAIEAWREGKEERAAKLFYTKVYSVMNWNMQDNPSKKIMHDLSIEKINQIKKFWITIYTDTEDETYSLKNKNIKTGLMDGTFHADCIYIYMEITKGGTFDDPRFSRSDTKRAEIVVVYAI